MRTLQEDIADGLVKNHSGYCIKVIVLRLESHQKSIARDCKRHTFFSLNTSKSSEVSVMFHYHFISFSL